MTHRGPFQTLPFCDSVIKRKKQCRRCDANICRLHTQSLCLAQLYFIPYPLGILNICAKSYVHFWGKKKIIVLLGKCFLLTSYCNSNSIKENGNVFINGRCLIRLQ